MSKLPNFFPASNLSAADEQRVLWYYRRYVEQYYKEYKFGHFLFAGYAAVPALLTPDLLYKIWQNFYGYKWGNHHIAIHRIAVADFLLSPLCKEVGFELYEMHHDLRLAFQQWLNSAATSTEWEGRGIRSVEQIASFIAEYHQQPNPGATRWGSGYHEVQEWGALTYSNHDAVQQQLSKRLTDALQAGKTTEALRLMDIWAKTARQVEGLYRNNTQKDLRSLRQNAHLIEAWKALIQQDSKAFLDKFGKNARSLDLLNDVEAGGIPVKVPSSVKQSVAKVEVKTIYALVVGIDKYRGEYTALNGCVNDALAGIKALEDYGKKHQIVLKCKKLLDEKATLTAIKSGFDFFNTARNGDICVFYFAGHANTMPQENNGRGIIAWGNSMTKVPVPTEISQYELEEKIYPIIAEKSVQCIWIFDTHDVKEESYKANLANLPHATNSEALKGAFVILNSSSIGQETYETKDENGKHSGLFTQALLTELNAMIPSVSYRTLIEKVRLRMSQRESNQDQTPYLVAFPSFAANYLFFSDELDSKVAYQIAYDTTAQEWRLQAGADKGIFPSYPFMHTLLKLRHTQQSIVAVNEVYKDYATLSNFIASDYAKVFDAFLLQNTMPKVKIGFDPSMYEGLRARLEDITKQWGIQFVELSNETTTATYFIQNRGEQYRLSRKLAIQDDPFSSSDMAIFHDDPLQFIYGVEKVAAWELVRNFGLSQPNTDKNITLNFLVREGWDANEMDTKIENGALRLHYKKKGNEWMPPGFRWQLVSKKKKNYAQAIYLGKDFSIKIFPLLKADSPKTRALGFESNDILTEDIITVHLDDMYFNQGITQKETYFKVFLSSHPIDLSLFTKAWPTENSSDPVVLSELEKIKPVFQEGAEWSCITVPVVVIREEMEEGTQEVGSNPVSLEELEKTKQELKQLVAEGKIEEAIQKIRNMDHLENKGRLESTLTLLSAQIVTVRKNETTTSIDSKEATRNWSKIAHSALEVINSLALVPKYKEKVQSQQPNPIPNDDPFAHNPNNPIISQSSNFTPLSNIGDQDGSQLA
jgi:hypothetical protein